MRRSPDDVAFDLGVRIRQGRHRLGKTRQDVEAETGVSPSAQSRVELGRGAGISLSTWVRLAGAAGEDLFGHEPVAHAGAYGAALTRLVAIGGWQPIQHDAGVLWFERAARPHDGLRHVLLPAERLVVRLIRTLTDVDREFERLRAAIEEARVDAPPGVTTSGTIVVVRSAATVRRARPSGLARSRAGWVGALRSSQVRMPTWLGWVWLAPLGRYLLP